MTNTINERIMQMIEYQGYSVYSYEKKFGFKRGVLSNIVAGRLTKPSFEVLQKLITSNDKINVNWLINGDGAMLKSNNYELLATDLTVMKEDHSGYNKNKLALQIYTTMDELKHSLVQMANRIDELGGVKGDSDT